MNNEDEDHADYDYQMYERNEMHSSMNESLNGDDEPNKSKQELRIKSISTRQQHQQPKSLTDTNRINPTVYFDEEFPDEMMGEPSRPVTTFKASSKQILDGMKRRIIFDEMNINNINKNNRPINSPENMMANDVLQSFNNLIVNSNGESSPTNEKGHFIPVNLIKTKSSNRNGNNIRFTNYSYYKKNNDIDYDQLLECLSKIDFNFSTLSLLISSMLFLFNLRYKNLRLKLKSSLINLFLSFRSRTHRIVS